METTVGASVSTDAQQNGNNTLENFMDALVSMEKQDTTMIPEPLNAQDAAARSDVPDAMEVEPASEPAPAAVVEDNVTSHADAESASTSAVVEDTQDVLPSTTDDATPTSTDLQLDAPKDSAAANGEVEVEPPAQAEFRFDSSDLESSDSDSDSDSDDSDEESLLDPKAMADLLMRSMKEADIDSGPPKTKNEMQAIQIEKPDVEITPEMGITLLGYVEVIIAPERTSDARLVSVKAKQSAEHNVYDCGTYLCLEDRKLLGVIDEAIGRVQEPFYTFYITQEDVETLNIAQGTAIYCVDQFSSKLFTDEIMRMKGTDASNLHDEELNDSEMEFSDDEKEAEYKRQKKAKAKKQSAGNSDQSGRNAPGRAGGNRGKPLPPRAAPYGGQPDMERTLLKYDDDDESSSAPQGHDTRPFSGRAGRWEGRGGRGQRGNRGQRGGNRHRGDRPGGNSYQNHSTGASHQGFYAGNNQSAQGSWNQGQSQSTHANSASQSYVHPVPEASPAGFQSMPFQGGNIPDPNAWGALLAAASQGSQNPMGLPGGVPPPHLLAQMAQQSPAPGFGRVRGSAAIPPMTPLPPPEVLAAAMSNAQMGHAPSAQAFQYPPPPQGQYSNGGNMLAYPGAPSPQGPQNAAAGGSGTDLAALLRQLNQAGQGNNAT